MTNNILFDWLGPIYDHIFGIKDSNGLKEALNLPAEGWLLDLGGGTGRSSAGLVDLVDHTLICDLSWPMLVEARSKGIPHMVQASATNLPFADGSFERTMVIDALHHMPDQYSTTGEMIRTLKSDGRLLIEEPDIRNFGVKLIALMEKVLMMKSTFHTPAEIQTMAEGHGGQVTQGSDGRGSAWIIVGK